MKVCALRLNKMETSLLPLLTVEARRSLSSFLPSSCRDGKNCQSNSNLGRAHQRRSGQMKLVESIVWDCPTQNRKRSGSGLGVVWDCPTQKRKRSGSGLGVVWDCPTQDRKRSGSELGVVWGFRWRARNLGIKFRAGQLGQSRLGFFSFRFY